MSPTVMKRYPALAAAAPMALDMAAPVVSFVVLHLVFGVSPVIALSIGAVVAGLRTVWRVLTERRVNAFSVMILVMLLATLLLVFITGDPRLVLAKSAVMPFVGGVYGLITNYVGRAVVFDVVAPFVTKGEPRLVAAWEGGWAHDAQFRGRLRLINLLWGVGFIISAIARVVIIYSTPLDVAVFAGQLPTLITLPVLICMTVRLSGPLRAALRREPAGGADVPVRELSCARTSVAAERDSVAEA
ncbi:VC0807 family protein [Nocardia brasiliensis]|uniref:VC0807 family protein n=1 Tax=Nocardia brasiliensis TaxID=37326 RepID=UPI0037B20AEC